MIIIIGGLGTDTEYFKIVCHEAKKHSFVKLMHLSPQNIEHHKQSIIHDLNRLYYFENSLDVYAFSASCLFLLHNINKLHKKIKVTLFDPPIIHKNNILAQNVLYNPLFPFVWDIIRYMSLRTLLCAVISFFENYTTPFSVNFNILSMSGKELKEFVRDYISVYHPFYFTLDRIIHIISSQDKRYSRYHELLAEKHDRIKVRKIQGNHHFLTIRTCCNELFYN